jgi:hypothetical protein
VIVMNGSLIWSIPRETFSVKGRTVTAISPGTGISLETKDPNRPDGTTKRIPLHPALAQVVSTRRPTSLA